MKTAWEKSITKGKECLLALAESDFCSQKKEMNNLTLREYSVNHDIA